MNRILDSPFDGLPCVRHSCNRCCYEAEMPLTEADMARLEGRGHDRKAFSVLDDELVAQLRMVDGHCYFLKQGRCSVHEVRPAGCRLYPLVWNQYSKRVELDDFCPFVREFPADPSVAEEVRATLATLEREAHGRRRSLQTEGEPPKPLGSAAGVHPERP